MENKTMTMRDVYNKDYNAMTDEEIQQRLDELSIIIADETFPIKYRERYMLEYVRDERRKMKDENAFYDFYEEHIEGKDMDEIDEEDWEYYSDWHKELYGCRPKMI